VNFILSDLRGPLCDVAEGVEAHIPNRKAKRKRVLDGTLREGQYVRKDEFEVLLVVISLSSTSSSCCLECLNPDLTVPGRSSIVRLADSTTSRFRQSASGLRS
jgi:hypothetical protein